MTLTITNQESHEPVLVLDQNESGLQVVGGDASMVQTLSLGQFRDLKEISDYINSAGSGFQASFDEASMGEDPQQNASPEDRMGPALNAIKDLLSRVGQRKKQDEEKKQSEKPEAEMAKDPNVEILQPEMGHIYVSLDGDNIGNAVARAEESDDEKTLSEMSAKINSGQDVLRNWAQRMGGKVIEQGGDEGLVKVPAASKGQVEDLRAQYVNVVGSTCSVGVGRKISESTKARMLAKLKGKNQTVTFDDSTAKELDFLLQDKDKTEANKIQAARNPADVQPGDKQQIQPQAAQPQAPEAAPPAQEKASPPEEDEQASKRVQLSPELVKAAGQPDQAKPKSIMASANHDPAIEDADYGYSEDPDFAKKLRYLAKYGTQRGE